MPTQVRWADGDELAHREAAQLPAEMFPALRTVTCGRPVN
jgi:hypothetical protein